MRRASEDGEAPRSDEREYSVPPMNLAAPVSQSGFPVSNQQWSRIKGQICGISSNESLWFSASLASLTGGISFLIGVVSLAQLEGVAFWITVSFYVAMTIGFTGAFLCFIFYKVGKKSREDDIKAVLGYMDEIEQTFINANR